MSTRKMRNVYDAFQKDLAVLVEKQQEELDYKVIQLTKTIALERQEWEGQLAANDIENELASAAALAALQKDHDIAITAMEIQVDAAQDAVMAVPEYQVMADEQAGIIESLRREIDSLRTSHDDYTVAEN